MARFLVLSHGFTDPTPEVQAAWGAWFTTAAPHLVDPGSSFSRGVEVTPTGRRDLDLSQPAPLTGYCIVEADDLAAAEALVAAMPIIDSVRVYEL